MRRHDGKTPTKSLSEKILKRKLPLEEGDAERKRKTEP
jgi:hypothetical protein